MEPNAALRELVEFVARSLVDDPDAVHVQVLERDRALVVELRVAPQDLGKVIGRQGRIAQALRTLAKATVRSGTRVTVEIVK